MTILVWAVRLAGVVRLGSFVVVSPLPAQPPPSVGEVAADVLGVFTTLQAPRGASQNSSSICFTFVEEPLLVVVKVKPNVVEAPGTADVVVTERVVNWTL